MKENNFKKPFFAAFLEKQITETEEVKGGATAPLRDAVTKPLFDFVTSPLKDVEHTLKYPSDGDDDVI